MSSAARAWLPANALADATVQTLVADCALSWAKCWLPDPRGCVANPSKLAGITKLPQVFTCWINKEHTLAMAMDDASICKLASHMLSAPAGGKLSVADLALYRQLAERSCSALMQDLAKLFGSEPPLGPARGAEVEVDVKYSLQFVGGGLAFDVFVANDLVLRARRSAAKSARPGVPLGRLSQAVESQQVSVGAVVGATKLALSELYGLAPGDVVVFDASLGDGVHLTVNNCVNLNAKALVQRSEIGLTLQVTEMGQALA
ncbi:MAG: FliM/FliN family flagellar motor C-terminal domain-containing protein [Vitreimonas sp.]